MVDDFGLLNGTDDVTGHDGVACSDAGDEVPFLFTVQRRDLNTSLEVVADHRADVFQRSLDTVVNRCDQTGAELNAQRRTGRHDFRAGAKSRSLFVDLDGRTVLVHFDNLTNQSLFTNANNVVHVGVPHAVRDDKGAGDLGNSTFGHISIHSPFIVSALISYTQLRVGKDVRTNCLFDKSTYILHTKTRVPLNTGDRDDSRLRTLAIEIQLRFDLGSKTLRDIDDPVTDFGHVPDVPDGFGGIVARMDIESDGGKAVNAVLVSDYCDFIHIAFSPSL